MWFISPYLIDISFRLTILLFDVLTASYHTIPITSFLLIPLLYIQYCISIAIQVCVKAIA